MKCYIDGKECNCEEGGDNCIRDPFREGDSAEDIRHLEVINGFRIDDEAHTVY